MEGFKLMVENANVQDINVPLNDLQLDLENPRFTDQTFENDEDLIRYLYDEMDVTEIIQSILSSGYLNYEPLIVMKRGDLIHSPRGKPSSCCATHTGKQRVQEQVWDSAIHRAYS